MGGGEGDLDHSFLGRVGLGDRECMGTAFGAIELGGAITFPLSSSSSSLSEDEEDEAEDEDEEEEDAIDLAGMGRVTGTVGIVTFRAAVGAAPSSSDDEDDEDDEDSSSTRLRFLLRARLGGIVVTLTV